MAPTGLLGWVKSYFPGEEEVVRPPPITTRTATLILVAYTLLYVLPFYVSSTTRPSPRLSRDAPSVIRGRIGAVTMSCLIASFCTFALISSVENGHPVQSLHQMGWFPPGLFEAAQSVGLTVILFSGPLFEAAIAEGAWRDWLRLRGAGELFGSWIGWRNIVAGPITEEILFRSASTPLFLLARAPNSTIIFGTPIIFGLAHVHHFYEFTLTHPHTPLVAALLRSLLQLSYTTLFGAYATFLYLRTGSLLAVILVHAFCNWMGLPRFWGRIGGVEVEMAVNGEGTKRDDDEKKKSLPRNTSEALSLPWTIVYYIILVAGAYGFYSQLWRLTESESGLVKF